MPSANSLCEAEPKYRTFVIAENNRCFDACGAHRGRWLVERANIWNDRFRGSLIRFECPAAANESKRLGKNSPSRSAQTFDSSCAQGVGSWA